MLKCLQFDKFLLYPTEETVECDGIKLDIRGRDFEVLHLLLRNPQRLVSKDTFLQEIWGENFVEEGNIAVCIKNIRKSLRAHSERTLIETVWGKGYRLLVDVVEVKKEARNFETQPGPDPHGSLIQLQNRTGKLQDNRYLKTLTSLGVLTYKNWFVLCVLIITLNIILLLLSSIYLGANVVLAILLLITLSIFVIWSFNERKEKEMLKGALEELRITDGALRQRMIESGKELDLEKMKVGQAEEAYNKLIEDFKHRLGYRVSKLEIRINIKDYDGGSHTRWIWTNITKERPDAIISRIPERIQFSTPGCSFKLYPVLSSYYENDYKLYTVTKNQNACEFYISAMEVTDNMSFEYIADINKAFCMTEEELAELPYDYEWFGYHVTSAIDTLVIYLSFPENYKPSDIQPDVYLGFFPTELSNDSEVDRIIKEKGFSIRQNAIVSMTVNRPKIGHHYALRWKPLQSESVNSIRVRSSNK